MNKLILAACTLGLLAVAACDNKDNVAAATDKPADKTEKTAEKAPQKAEATAAACTEKMLALQTTPPGDAEKKFLSGMCEAFPAELRTCIVSAKAKEDAEKCLKDAEAAEKAEKAKK